MQETQSPYIQSGPNVGRVADPLVAHEMANTVDSRFNEKFASHAGWFQKLLWRVTGARQRFAIREGTDSAHYQAQETVEKERTDPLTGLLNKTAYHQDRESLYSDITDGEEVIVARLDMGLLNYFNQVRGHGVGDEYLKQAATLIDGVSFQNLQDIYRSCVFARAYHESGDEFVILLKAKKNRAGEVVHTLRRVLYQNIHNLALPGGDITVGDKGNEYKVDKGILLDIGITTSTEGRQMLGNVLLQGDPKRDIKRSALMGKVVDRIADTRVDMSKAIKRLRMLRELLLQDRALYMQIYSYASKGALSVEEEVLRSLVTDENIHDWVARIYVSRLENDARRNDDVFQKRLAIELAKASGRFVIKV